MSGLVIIDGGLTKTGSLEQINLTLEMEELILFDQGEISIHGQLLYSDSTLSTTDQVLLMINDNYLTLDGNVNFKTNHIDILTDLEKAEIQLIHACIWFALTGYVKEDYDAVLFSFYKGCQLWTEAVSD